MKNQLNESGLIIFDHNIISKGNRLPILLFWLITLFSTLSFAQIPGGLCNWDNNKKAAIVLTFDDWSPGHYPLVVPALSSRNINATFFVTLSQIPSAAEWTKVNTAATNGNEIGNHTKTHPNLTALSGLQKKDEIRAMKALIDLNIPGQKCTALATPFGASNAAVIDSIKASGHITARSVSPGTYNYNFISTNNDYYNISTFSMDNTITIGAYTTQIQNVIAGGGLLTFLYHSIDNAAGSYGDNWFAKILDTNLGLQLDQIVAVKNAAWITTFSKAIKYHKERNCATLTETQAPNGTNWKFNLIDTLNNAVFDQPLSIKLKMNGVNYTSVTQNGIAVAIDLKQNDSIMFHALPDAGPIVLSTSIAAPVTGLNVKDSTFNNGVNTIPVYVVDWLDNNAKPRKVVLTKSYAPDNYPGVAVLIKYYDGAILKTITSQTPADPEKHNRGFGCTVHHYSGGGWVDQNSPTFTLRYLGAHHAIFDLVQLIDGATETVTYTFKDGLDYFQWQQTVNCSAVTSGTYDSRSPYSTVDWDGNGVFDAVTGQEYEAQNYFNQPSYNGAFTFGAAGKKGIPFVRQWRNSSEVGYVQTQTYTQQQSGVPAYSSANIPASGGSVAGGYLWAFDYQMNFYDMAQKITWGMPYGYIEGQAGTGVKSNWGQYSLSILFDALSNNGVNRVRDENVLIHNGNVILTATIGSVVTTGPVGTANPTLQTLSPVGFDHNYRTWWVQADGTEQTVLAMNVTSGTIKNPTFRIKSMTAIPAIVQYNSLNLVANVDYYASYNASTNEAWVTILRNVSGSNTIRFSLNSSVLISSAIVTPSSVSNNTAASLTFNVNATTSTGSISSVVLNLSTIGGGAAVAMTSSGLNTWTSNFITAIGLANGTYTIPVLVTDNLLNTATANITLTVISGTSITAASVTPNSVFNNVFNPLVFSVSAIDDGSISSVVLDLSSIGGSSSFAMTPSGGNNFTGNYSMASGISVGTKSILVSVTDNVGNVTTQTISIVVTSSMTYLDIYTDASTLVTGTWTGNAPSSIVEQNGGGAIEGVKDYLVNYTVASWWAGLGLNLSNWSDAQAKDFSTYTSLELSYQGPIAAGAGLELTLRGPGGTSSIVRSLPLSASYISVSIPLSYFSAFDLTKITEIDFAITGLAAGTGSLRLDNIRLSKPSIILPLNLLSFTGEASSNNTLLSWTSLNENNCLSFQLEKSLDGISFSTIYTTKCLGNLLNKYSFIDEEVLQKITYYRLVQVDNNGLKSNSILVVNPVVLDSYFTLFPNPIQNNGVVSILSSSAGNLELYDSKGIHVFSKEINSNKLLMVSTNEWAKGIYIYYVYDQYHIVQTGKLIVE